MNSTLGIALSGLQANAARVATASNNIANLRSSGPLDQPQQAYQPEVTTTVALGGGGVTTSARTVNPATSAAYAPDDPNANAEGLVAMPNVNLENEIVEQMSEVIGYKANAGAIRAQNAMDRSLLNLMV